MPGTAETVLSSWPASVASVASAGSGASGRRRHGARQRPCSGGGRAGLVDEGVVLLSHGHRSQLSVCGLVSCTGELAAAGFGLAAALFFFLLRLGC